MAYIYDGELSIDNGASERDIRPIKVGANNWLFSGSDAGGAAVNRPRQRVVVTLYPL